jgi:TPR repeat protein
MRTILLRVLVPLAVLLAFSPATAGVRDDYRACTKDTFTRLKPGGDAAAKTAADQYCLAVGYNFGKPPFSRDPSRAVALLQRAVAQDYPPAMTALGYHFERGAGIARNEAQALALYRQAAAKGHADGMFNLGRLYQLGRGVPRDERESDRWFNAALKAGSIDAIVHFRRARQLEMEDNARPLFEQAFKAYEANKFEQAARLYRQAAELGNASAQVALGQLTRLGMGVPKNEEEAVRLYRRAAERGHAGGQTQLGLAFQLGEGVREDWAEAHAWCAKSAAQQYALGLLCVGRQFQFGLGVAQDRNTAIRYFEMAEDQGDGTGAFLARYLSQSLSCLGYINNDERKKYAGVCDDPKRTFRNSAERTAYLTEAIRTARVDSFNAGGYEGGLCRARGLGYGGGGCQGEGGRILDPYGNQDRFGRSAW